MSIKLKSFSRSIWEWWNSRAIFYSKVEPNCKLAASFVRVPFRWHECMEVQTTVCVNTQYDHVLQLCNYEWPQMKVESAFAESVEQCHSSVVGFILAP